MNNNVREFDMPELFRKDTLVRIRYLETEIEERKRIIAEIKIRLPDKERHRNANKDR